MDKASDETSEGRGIDSRQEVGWLVCWHFTGLKSTKKALFK